MSDILSIESATKQPWKQKIKFLAGQSIALLSPGRAQQLFENPISNPTTLTDKMLMAFLKRQAIMANETSFIERLHQNFWAHDGGAQFADNCDHRFEDLFLAKQRQDFQALQSLWCENQPEHIVELGCNSGLLLNYLTKQLPGVKSAIGIDINLTQIERNNRSANLDKRIEFVCADGCEWIATNALPNCLFVTNGGVLEYLRRDRLNHMLTYINNHIQPAYFFTVEPVAADHNWDTTKDSVPFGKELSFSHNYLDLFQSNGFSIQHQRDTQFESWQMFATIAVSKKPAIDTSR